MQQPSAQDDGCGEVRRFAPATVLTARMSLRRDLLRLAGPNILSNVSVPLLSSVDTALMGQLSAAHLGAVGIAGMLFNFLYWNFGFLRMGTTGLTAQAYGAGDDAEAAGTLARAALLALAVAAGLLLLQVPLYALGTRLLNVPAATAPLVADYFFVRIYAAPASLLLYVGLGWLFGMQDARRPLLVAVLSNVLNVGLSYYLVAELGMGTRGVAWGTVGAQYFALALVAGLLRRAYPDVLGAFRQNTVATLSAYTRLLRVNGDLFVRTLCLTLAFAFLYSRAAADSALSLAVVTVLLQFLNWMSYGVDGFAYAAESLVGRFAGAADPVRLRAAVGLSMRWGAGLAAGFALLYAVAGEALVGVFTEDAAVAAGAVALMPWLVALPLVGAACYIWDGAFVGLTATRAMRDTMLLSLGLYVGAYFLLRGPLGEVAGLWAALLVFLGGRGLLQWAWWRWGTLAPQAPRG